MQPFQFCTSIFGGGRQHRCMEVVLFRRVSRTTAQLHQYALLWALRIWWLCPEHDLKLFTCFCVSPCRKNSSDKTQKASLCSGRFIYVMFIICHSCMNGTIWFGLEDLSCIPSFLFSICKELFAYVVLSGGTIFFQGIGEHMNGPTILASSTMSSEWISRGRICHSLRLSFCFSPSTQGQLPASCQI